MSYTYSERLGDREIRLLELVESHDNDSLLVHLGVYKMDVIEFEALSYVWGDPSRTVEIHCNGLPFQITDNLHAALLERRRRNITSLMWVDALCINQDDTEERTRQVRMMKEIYSKAQRVVIWLGREVDHDEKGIELAERIYNDCDGASFDVDKVQLDVRVEDFNYHEQGFPTPFVHPSTARDPGWRSLFDMLELPWFTRVWVLQELLVAKKSIMWRGGLDLNPRSILFVAVLVDTKRSLWIDFSRHTLNGTCPARNVATLYFQFQKKGPQPFWDTLRLCRNMEASDRRDRYFALVGLSTGLEYEIVDYSKTFGEIHAQVGYICLCGLPERGLQSTGLDLLAFGHYRYHMTAEFGVASWVPGLISGNRFDATLADAYTTAELCRTKRGYAAAKAGVDFSFITEDGHVSKTGQMRARPNAYPVPFVSSPAFHSVCSSAVANLHSRTCRD